jgi:methylated-DNA-protein-cysteine methyltransferase-like protein
MPGNPRGVVRALKLAKNIPWWRVIRADGTVAPELAEAQLPRLRAEGLVPRGRRVVARSASARKPAGARRH